MAETILPKDNSGSNWLDSVLKLAGGAVDTYAKLNESKVNALEKKADIPSTTIQPTATAPGTFQLQTKHVLIGVAVLGAVVGGVVLVRTLRG